MRTYLLSVISAGILCACATALFPPKDGVGKLIGLICALFMTMTVISPLIKIDVVRFADAIDLQSEEKDALIEDGQNQAKDALRKVITEQCRTYIVEKANGMGVKIDAQFTLNNDEIPTPESVTITGSIPPYAKTVLETALVQELGIPKEQQIWK